MEVTNTFSSLSDEELQKKLDELTERQYSLKKLANYANAMQMALKLVLNGSYGAFANQFFAISNKEIAAAITAMGREIIQYMDRCNEEYWYTKFHLDAELHARLGVTDVIPLDPMYRNRKTGELVAKPDKSDLKPNEDGLGPMAVRVMPVSIYADTDSLFVGFDAGMKACGWTGSPMEFVMTVNDVRLEGFFKDKLLEYAARYGVENVQDFELERVNESIIMLQKKRYVQHVAWEDKVSFKQLEYLYPKGVELVKSSTPPFAREKVREIIEYLFRHPDDYNMRDLLKLVRDIKKQFELADIEDISETTSCNNYHKHIANDDEKLEYNSGAPAGVKAAALHNHLLNRHPEQKQMYEHIKSGSRIKTYYCKHPLNDKFGYIRGKHPREFAPEPDIDTQFEKTVLNQVNTFVKALNMPELNKRLRVVLPLF